MLSAPLLAVLLFGASAGNSPVVTPVSQATPSVTQTSAVRSRITALLNAYGRKDIDGVVAMLTPDRPVMYGSDVREVFTSADGVRSLLRSDYAQWDSAQFGAIRNVNIETDGTLATAFFDAPFTMTRGGRSMTVTVRFATVWKRIRGAWFLAQSDNFTPRG